MNGKRAEGAKAPWCDAMAGGGAAWLPRHLLDLGG